MSGHTGGETLVALLAIRMRRLADDGQVGTHLQDPSRRGVAIHLGHLDIH